MNCPKCGGRLIVTETRNYKGVEYRRRKCKVCGNNTFTAETEVEANKFHHAVNAYKNGYRRANLQL